MDARTIIVSDAHRVQALHARQDQEPRPPADLAALKRLETREAARTIAAGFYHIADGGS